LYNWGLQLVYIGNETKLLGNGFVPKRENNSNIVIDRKFGGKPWAETPQRLLHFAAVSIEVHGHGRGCLRRGNHEVQGTKTDLTRALKIHQYTSITYHLAI